ncbi:sensor histidine kinase [Subtercola boreus]|uniref:sensor histidine kinase n=1 Tax=Subtercola boreus TaxID=120213 RepID=UPI000E2FA1FD|nr:histidine kinase [Subtercola boreus]TQL53758.1 signal transduction histidine kinase [Subtercola boreus]
MWTWFETRPRLADAAIAAAAFVLLGAADFVRDGAGGTLIDIVLALSLAFWRRLPGLGLAIAWVGALVQVATVDGLLVGDILILAAVFATGLAESRAVRWAGLASSVVGGGIAGARLILFAPATGDGALVPVDPFYRGVYFGVVSGVVAAALSLFWALGVLVRNRRAAVILRSERDRDRIVAEARLTQERERALLSREMHDLVGHALAVVIAQSDGARYAKATDPAAETTALETINRTARSALDDVRELLSVLREPGDGSASGSGSTVDLDLLVRSVREAGLDVVVSETGIRMPLTAAHDLAMFRVLQESLTNAIRHGGRGTSAIVSVDWGTDDVRFGVTTVETGDRVQDARVPDVRVQDVWVPDARAGAAPGQGLIGMRERMRLLNGSVETGPRTDGSSGFRVAARLPYRAPEVQR